MPDTTSSGIQETAGTARHHPFVSRPHRTLARLAVPVLFSLIAEPLTGLVDTAFIARLGSVALAGLGVGTAALSSIFWIFNFIGIGTQTEVANALGRTRSDAAARFAGMAIAMAVLFGVGLLLVGIPLLRPIASLLGASGDVAGDAVQYMHIRLFGGPAVLVSLAAFGALRGLQDMRTPMWISLAVNVLNIGLDAVLVLGWGPFPGLGIAGVALASVAAQWLGALWSVTVLLRKLGMPDRLNVKEGRQLIRIGGDLFLRTAALTLYLALTTRVATRIGADAGAAHQAVRQFWVFSALGLDAVAVTAQSLVGYFIGAAWIQQARRVAAISCHWSFGFGVLLALIMWAGRDLVAGLLVPMEAHGVFLLAWLPALALQPLNALAFATDGIQFGTGDYRFLRNAVLIASTLATVLLFAINEQAANALAYVWIVTGFWIVIRAIFGVARIWPGIGASPLRKARH